MSFVRTAKQRRALANIVFLINSTPAAGLAEGANVVRVGEGRDINDNDQSLIVRLTKSDNKLDIRDVDELYDILADMVQNRAIFRNAALEAFEAFKDDINERHGNFENLHLAIQLSDSFYLNKDNKDISETLSFGFRKIQEAEERSIPKNFNDIYRYTKYGTDSTNSPYSDSYSDSYSDFSKQRSDGLIFDTELFQQNALIKAKLLNKNKKPVPEAKELTYEEYQQIIKNRKTEAIKLRQDELTTDDLNQYLQSESLLINRQIYSNDRWGRPII